MFNKMKENKDTINSLVNDIKAKFGGSKSFNVVCQAVISGASLSSFTEYNSSGKTRHLFNDHRIEFLSITEQLAAKLNISTLDYVVGLAKNADWMPDKEMVKGYNMLTSKHKWECAYSDPYVDNFDSAAALVAQHFICIDVITKYIKSMEHCNG